MGQRIAGDGACKIAAWLSTLCAGSSDVEMVCVGTSKAPVYARIVGLPLSTSVGLYWDEGRRCFSYQMNGSERDAPGIDISEFSVL